MYIYLFYIFIIIYNRNNNNWLGMVIKALLHFNS
jgi:hypothetical protein